MTPPDTITSFEVFGLLSITSGVTLVMVTFEVVILIDPALPFSTSFVTFGDSEVLGVWGFVTNDHQNIIICIIT